MKNIAIVGCGPAGLSAAIALNDVGHQVTLFEQFDQPGPVGSGLMLQPTGLRVLERWGLRDQVEALGQRIDGMLGRVAPDGKIVLDINYRVLSNKSDGELYGVAIHRAALFDVLHKAVQTRNIVIATGEKITNVLVSSAKEGESNFGMHTERKAHDRCPFNNTVQLINRRGTALSAQFDLVVDASGSGSKLTEHAGQRTNQHTLKYGALWTTVKLDDPQFDKHILEQRYKGASVMVGVLPCGHLPNNEQPLATLFWSIKGDDYAAFKAAGLQAWKNSVISHWPAVASLLEHITHTNQLTHATYTHHTLKRPYAPGIVFIGDAAHATSPQLGQGANMALLDALALSAAINSNPNHADYAALYARIRRNHVSLFQAASYLLTPFYQSDSRLLPALRDTLFEPVSKLPFSNKMVTLLGSGLMTNPIKTIDTKIAGVNRAMIN